MKFSWIWFVTTIVSILLLVRIGVAVWMFWFIDDFSADGTYGTFSTSVEVAVALGALGLGLIAGIYFGKQRR
jgi:hypothetical protein